ncbi:hypothetical protein [Shewanella woodyi]|uniref:hypothetical protein n=1 Tax=Shewanella woodyi TaxID=60961 RepID=UPI0007F86537|nr:hypothetical protein [Shewanella woodyi]
MKAFILVLASVAVLGCSSQNEVSNVVGKKEAESELGGEKRLIATGGYKCEKIKVIGSNIPQKRCTTEKMRKKEEKEAEKFLKEFESGGTATD